MIILLNGCTCAYKWSVSGKILIDFLLNGRWAEPTLYTCLLRLVGLARGHVHVYITWPYSTNMSPWSSTQELCKQSIEVKRVEKPLARGPFYALPRWCSVKSTSQRPHLSYPTLYIWVTLRFTFCLPCSSHLSYPVRQGSSTVKLPCTTG
jgi:hypothetical protein